MNTFEMLRSERRSFFCPNKLWKELKHQTKHCSISHYLRLAIIEKFTKNEPEKAEYYKQLL